MATTAFSITHSRAGDYQGTADMTARNAVGRLVNFITGCASGAHGATMLAVSETNATGELTLDGANVVVTVIAGREMPQVDDQGDDQLTAAAIAAVINDPESGVSEAVTAEAVGSVVVITANAPGVIGNYISLSVSGIGITASGPALSGGTTTTYNF